MSNRSRKKLDELRASLDQILQDPDRIKKIMEAASAMGFLQSINQNEADGFPGNVLHQMTNSLQQTAPREQRQQLLLQALLPYLSPGRRIRLERAVQISQFSRLAGSALKTSNPVINNAEEDENNV